MSEKVKLEDAVEKAIAAREQSKKLHNPHEREEHILEFLDALIEGLEEARNQK